MAGDVEVVAEAEDGDEALDQLVGAVRTLAHGGTLLEPAITDRLIRAIRVSHPHDGGDDRLGELAEGTVKDYVSNVLLKLVVRDRTRAVLPALHLGIRGGDGDRLRR